MNGVRSALPRHVQLVEIAVFLLVLVPSMALPALGMRPEELTFKFVAIAVIAHNVGLVSLVLYLVWRSGEGLGAVGWSAHQPGREALLGVVLFIPFFVGLVLLEGLLRRMGLSAPSAPPAYLLPQGGGEYVLALVLVTAVAIGEETIFRGYLIRRFAGVAASRTTGVVLSTVIFAVGHAYQGSVGVVAVGAIALAFTAIYFWRGSLVAPIVMHFLQDFLGILIAPRFLGS